MRLSSATTSDNRIEAKVIGLAAFELEMIQGAPKQDISADPDLETFLATIDGTWVPKPDLSIMSCAIENLQSDGVDTSNLSLLKQDIDTLRGDMHLNPQSIGSDISTVSNDISNCESVYLNQITYASLETTANPCDVQDPMYFLAVSFLGENNSTYNIDLNNWTGGSKKDESFSVMSEAMGHGCAFALQKVTNQTVATKILNDLAGYAKNSSPYGADAFMTALNATPPTTGSYDSYDSCVAAWNTCAQAHASDPSTNDWHQTMQENQLFTMWISQQAC